LHVGLGVDAFLSAVSRRLGGFVPNREPAPPRIRLMDAVALGEGHPR